MKGLKVDLNLSKGLMAFLKTPKAERMMREALTKKMAKLEDDIITGKVKVDPRPAVPDWRGEATIDPNCYCPNCGAHGKVLVQDGEGDYYLGPVHECQACDHVFHLP